MPRIRLKKVALVGKRECGIKPLSRQFAWRFFLCGVACLVLGTNGCATEESVTSSGSQGEARRPFGYGVCCGIPDPSKHPSWNTWFRSTALDEPEMVETLKVGHTYTFTLDLSPYRYSGLGVHGESPSKELLRHLEPFRSDATVYAVPVVAGRGMVILPSLNERARPFKIDTQRLRHPGPGRMEDESVYKFAQRVHAGQMEVEVKAIEGGCAALGVSIWNESLDRPLDHIVRAIPIVGLDGVIPNCFGESTKAIEEGSFLSLLGSPDHPAQAALHLFDIPLGQNVYSNAVFVAKRQGVAQVFAWKLKASPAQLIEDKSFLKALDEARSEKDYTGVAEKFTNRIFPPMLEEEEGLSEVRKASQALGDALQMNPSAVFFARLVDVKGRNVFLPFGLIKVGGELLGKKLRVVQPLPRETYSQSDKCILSWTLVLPKDLGDKDWDKTLKRDLRAYGKRITTIEELKKYAIDKSNTGNPEGLVLLSHHGEGSVWFNNQANYFSFIDDFGRRFSRASVAVVSACGVANLGDQGNQVSLRLVEALNNHNVDAVLISPFNVPIGVGIALAQAFSEEVAKASVAKETPDFAELFSRAILAAVSDGSPVKSLVNEESFLEFFIAGNAGLRLCPARGDQNVLLDPK